MKKRYTKKQILESIKYWKKVLKESFGNGEVGCYVHINSPYGSGDEDWLYVADDITKLAYGLFPAEQSGNITYNGMTAELHSADAVKLVAKMHKDSMSKRGAVSATLELEDTEDDVDFNFYSTDAIDFGHLVLCD